MNNQNLTVTVKLDDKTRHCLVDIANALTRMADSSEQPAGPDIYQVDLVSSPNAPIQICLSGDVVAHT